MKEPFKQHCDACRHGFAEHSKKCYGKCDLKVDPEEEMIRYHCIGSAVEQSRRGVCQH